MLVARYSPYILKFKIPAGTSRGVLREKLSYFIAVHDSDDPGAIGLGECGLLDGLSADDTDDYTDQLDWLCSHINDPKPEIDHALTRFPSIRFGWETAMRDLEEGGVQHFFNNAFGDGDSAIPINGLVWMGSAENMSRQVEKKIEAGFDCIKLKIGAIDFDEEFALLKQIRKDFSAKDITIRVDANGAFSLEEAPKRLRQLAELDLHSIEQPIAAGQVEAMALLCEKTPLPIALDEELIGVFSPMAQMQLLETIKPQFIIIKPSLLGGWKASENWIELANDLKCGWWVTSALESNVGLNAIAQWTAELKTELPQGLGTGQLYANNFPSPLRIANGKLHNDGAPWNLDDLWEQPWQTSG